MGRTTSCSCAALTGDLLSTWEQPLLVRHVEGLASVARVLMLDKRGTGLSDRVRDLPTLETRMDDMRAVMDACGAERALFFTGHEGSQLALLFAATYPERTRGLILIEPWVKGTGQPEYPWAPTEEEWRRRVGRDQGRMGAARLLRGAPPRTVSSRRQTTQSFNRLVRRSHASQRSVPQRRSRSHRMSMEADVSDVLPASGCRR